uniref:Uncharacterized protein n=1 Tax=Rhizophora mucronata TaxID=61149 RepID=A0A2P2PAB6_RHIMU
MHTIQIPMKTTNNFRRNAEEDIAHSFKPDLKDSSSPIHAKKAGL